MIEFTVWLKTVEYNLVLGNISFLFAGSKICLALNNASLLIYVGFTKFRED